MQEVGQEESTGVWSNEEAVSKHIPAPTLSMAHFLRIVSANRSQRDHVKKTFHGSFLPSEIDFKDEKGTDRFIEDLRWAVYTTCLVSYVQGMYIIDSADREHKWCIDYSMVVQIWRAGCIIRADHIADLLEEIFSSFKFLDARNLLYNEKLVEELKRVFEPLKRVILKATEANTVT
jgi:6-phosphogluconate dehydrogenase